MKEQHYYVSLYPCVTEDWVARERLLLYLVMTDGLLPIVARKCDMNKTCNAILIIGS